MKNTLTDPTTVLKTLICIFCISASLSVSPISRADVFTSSVSLHSAFVPPPHNQPGWEIQAFSNPNNTGDGGWLEITSSNLVLSGYSGTIGIGHIWYNVGYGTAVDPSLLSTGTPFYAITSRTLPPWTPGKIQLSLGQDFYLGFVLEEGLSNTYRYGWAHLELTSPTTLTLLGNAIEDSGSGIIVGTMTVVPEPSTISLTALSIMLMLAWSPLNRLRSRTR
jgi:hypothetical protein